MPIVILIGNILLFTGSIITLLFSRRGNKADTLAKLEAIIDKVQERADKLYDDKVAGEVMAEKLRGDLATALVDIRDLEKDLAKANGYIQGVSETNPLIHLDANQKAAMGRRAMDKI